jgi:hypothetical protein
MIRAGRNGEVRFDPTGAGGATLVPIMSIKGWKLSLKTDKINVTCFQDQNKVYVPGLRDIAGTLTGFYNSSDLTLIEATEATAPGMLELVPDTTDPIATPTYVFSGLAYLDAEIDTNVEGAPALSSEILAAGPWTIPAAALLAGREVARR